MAIEFPTQRRLPVYLLVDCSTSMTGFKIREVNRGIKLLQRELSSDPRSADTVHLCIIHFADRAEKLDLTAIDKFGPPEFEAEGTTNLTHALQLLNDSLDHDLTPNLGDADHRGDYKPLVFLLTDGQPTDDEGYPTDSWRPEALRLLERTKFKTANIVALAVGADADERLLQQITPYVLKMEEQRVNSNMLAEYFKWVSASIQAASERISRGQTDSGAHMPSPPQGLVPIWF